MRNMAGLIPYIQLSQLAKINGGPNCFIKSVFDNGVAAGFSSGYVAGNTAGFIKGGIAGGGAVLVGFGIYKGVKVIKKLVNERNADLQDRKLEGWTEQ